MGVLKKNFVQNIFNILSIVAVVMATVSFVSVNNFEKAMIENKTANWQKNKTSRFIKEIPDVEIVNADGSIVKLNSTEDNYDELKGLQYNGNKSNDENNVRDNSDYNKEKFLDKKKVVVKKDSSDLKKIIPVSRNENIKDKTDVENPEKKVKNDLFEKKNSENNESNDNINRTHDDTVQKVTLHAKNLGNFVVQVAAFKNMVQAENQCKKIEPAIKDKHCGVVTLANSFYCSIVYPFDSRDEANEFSKKMSEKIKVKCFVRTNA